MSSNGRTVMGVLKAGERGPARAAAGADTAGGSVGAARPAARAAQRRAVIAGAAAGRLAGIFVVRALQQPDRHISNVPTQDQVLTTWFSASRLLDTSALLGCPQQQHRVLLSLASLSILLLGAWRMSSWFTVRPEMPLHNCTEVALAREICGQAHGAYLEVPQIASYADVAYCPFQALGLEDPFLQFAAVGKTVTNPLEPRHARLVCAATAVEQAVAAVAAAGCAGIVIEARGAGGAHRRIAVPCALRACRASACQG